jgi:hypothetical protein
MTLSIEWVKDAVVEISYEGFAFAGGTVVA